MSELPTGAVLLCCISLLPVVISLLSGVSCTKNNASDFRDRWFQSTLLVFKHVINLKSLATVVQRNRIMLRHGLFYRSGR